MRKSLDFYKNLFESNYLKYLEKISYDPLYNPIKEFISRGGKRLRSSLCLLVCDSLGGNLEKALPTAISIEFFHNFTLIHDDIEDDGLLRRGKPTLHLLYGVPRALNYGDYLYAFSYYVLKDNEKLLGKDVALEILNLIIDNELKIAEGQAMDLEFRFNRNITMDTIFEILKKKTGVVFGLAAELGSLISGATTISDRKIIRSSFEKFGISFQIKDDILNLTSEKQHFGKTIGDDISEGKPTLPLIYTLSLCEEPEKEYIINHIGKPFDSSVFENILNIFQKYGAIDYSENVAESLVEDGKESLRQTNLNVDDFEYYIDKLINRKN